MAAAWRLSESQAVAPRPAAGSYSDQANKDRWRRLIATRDGLAAALTTQLTVAGRAHDVPVDVEVPVPVLVGSDVDWGTLRTGTVLASAPFAAIVSSIKANTFEKRKKYL